MYAQTAILTCLTYLLFMNSFFVFMTGVDSRLNIVQLGHTSPIDYMGIPLIILFNFLTKTSKFILFHRTGIKKTL